MNAICRKFVRISPDDENNADAWWAAIDEAAPRLANALRSDGTAVVEEDVYASLAALPGFSDGPEYARDALRVETCAGPGWESLG